MQKTRYCDDKKITDHYAVIPTGQGLGALRSLPVTTQRIYEVIVRRFLSIFYPSAEYLRLNLQMKRQEEHFFASFKVLKKSGYLEIATASFAEKKRNVSLNHDTKKEEVISGEEAETDHTDSYDATQILALQKLRKGTSVSLDMISIREGETSPPKRYNSGSIILAMENAGQLIEDEELRAHIKGSGIGTSATRAEILSKLVRIHYLKLNKKTQMITPELLGEMVYDIVACSIQALLWPEMTASWEKGLNQVAEGETTETDYMEKLEAFIRKHVDQVKNLSNQYQLKGYFDQAAKYYK